jgi:hypothetical protein
LDKNKKNALMDNRCSLPRPRDFRHCFEKFELTIAVGMLKQNEVACQFVNTFWANANLKFSRSNQEKNPNLNSNAFSNKLQ